MELRIFVSKPQQENQPLVYKVIGVGYILNFIIIKLIVSKITYMYTDFVFLILIKTNRTLTT